MDPLEEAVFGEEQGMLPLVVAQDVADYLDDLMARRLCVGNASEANRLNALKSLKWS